MASNKKKQASKNPSKPNTLKRRAVFDDDSSELSSDWSALDDDDVDI